MLIDHEHQSMLITGESGAGKTENTKKVIQYIAKVAGVEKSDAPKSNDGVARIKGDLDEQVVEANPLLEAFGNAKTTRNNNSSRFGKFIRCHFSQTGKLAGADIESYLLEKNRVIHQGAQERNYHIFYQLLYATTDEELASLCLLTREAKEYGFLAKGVTHVDRIDDHEEYGLTVNAVKVLGFTPEEKDSMFKITAGILNFSCMKFKQKPRDEQAEVEDPADGERVAYLLGLTVGEFHKSLIKPKVKVGTEYVNKGQSVDQVLYAVAALSKALFERMFWWIVARVNKALDSKERRSYFIGVLDIAGFEIFDYNSFEQICINLTNEKLQQFFNHHMFALEQEEYKKEEIQWTFIDFGMDLAACIELFEKPMGVLAILEEESMFPKATDKSFAEKLTSNCLGKSPAFIKPKGDAHMGICHYAGTVNHGITGWLEKNKDPLNDTVVDQLKNGKNRLLVKLFASHPGQSFFEEKAKGKGGKKKSGGFKSVSSGYRDQLNNLMTTLNSTSPHFIRCIVPNETKSPGVVLASLIMHQLTCNGVLEGIRICQLGLPNRMPYADFKQRYKILGAQFFAQMDDKEAVKATFNDVGLDPEKYRVGKNKVFFRAGVLGQVEDIRDEVIGKMVCSVQNWVRGYLGRKRFKVLQEQRIALVIVQRTVKKYMSMKSWSWFYLWSRVKPLINQPRIEDEIKAIKERSDESVALCKAAEDKAAMLEAQHAQLLKDIEDMKVEVEQTAGNAAAFIENQALIAAQKAELEKQFNEAAQRFEQEQSQKALLMQQKKRIEGDVGSQKRDLEDLEMNLQRLNQEGDTKNHQIRVLHDEIAAQEEVINKINREKKSLQEINQRNADDFSGSEDKVSHSSKVKAKLEQTIDEMGDSLNREKKTRGELEKSKRKIENDMKLTQDSVSDLERNKKELESMIFKRDAEINNLSAKYEDEQLNGSKASKGIKELQSRVEELEDEIKHESQGRAKAENAKKKLQAEIDEINDRLDEAGGATSAQMELNKKREAELAKLKRDIEESNIQHEAAVAAFRKKHNDSIAEMSEQIDHLTKMKQKIEKEKDVLKREGDDAKAAMDGLTRDKAASEKIYKTVQNQLNEVQSKLDEAQRTLGDFDAQKKKLYVENGDLLRQLEEVDIQINQMSKLTIQLGNQLDDIKKTADDENKERSILLGKYRNLEHDLDGLSEQLNEESEHKADLLRQLSRANAEAQMYRAKYESEGIARAEELEAARLKLQARLEEAEQTIEQLNFKNANLEKLKGRMAQEYDAMHMECERAQMQLQLLK